MVACTEAGMYVKLSYPSRKQVGALRAERVALTVSRVYKLSEGG